MSSDLYLRLPRFKKMMLRGIETIVSVRGYEPKEARVREELEIL